MLDFKALMNMTPEQRKADRDAAQAKFDADRDAKIKTRSEMILSLSAVENLSEWETEFLASMNCKLSSKDLISNIIGGELAFLSESQIKSLNKMHLKYISVEDLEECKPIARTIYPSRPRY